MRALIENAFIANVFLNMGANQCESDKLCMLESRTSGICA